MKVPAVTGTAIFFTRSAQGGAQELVGRAQPGVMPD